MRDDNRRVAITAAVVLSVNGFVLCVDAHGKANDVNADNHDLVALTQSATATAAIMLTEVVENCEDKTGTIVSDSITEAGWN